MILPQPGGLQALPEDLEAAGLQGAGIFLDLVKVGVELVLSHFVADHRYPWDDTPCGCRIHVLHARAVLDGDLACSAGGGIHILRGDRVVIVGAGFRRGGLHDALGRVAHGVAAADEAIAGEAHAHEHVLLIQHLRRPLEIVRTGNVELVRIKFPVLGQHAVELALAAPQLVAHGHEHEGRVMPEFPQHAQAFAKQEGLLGRVVALLALLVDGAPEGQLG